MTLHQKFKSHT